MSYPDVNDPQYEEKILRKREFIALKYGNYKYPNDSWIDENYLYNYNKNILDRIQKSILSSDAHQNFVKNLLNVNTKNRSIHLTHAPGTGKTIASALTAKSFIDYWKENIPEDERPRVVVLGFNGTKTGFMRELTSWAAFGFVTQAEIEEKNARLIAMRTNHTPDTERHYKEYFSYLKKKIMRKNKGGAYVFYGYDEFVNKLFSNDVKLTEVEKDIDTRRRAGEDVSLEDEIRRLIIEGKIKVDKKLLEELKNSVIIADEIHNTYNMNMKNNRGVALQYALEEVPSCRFISLSATPINNLPEEIIDLLNYHCGNILSKRDFFSTDHQPLPGAIERIGELARGKFSFLHSKEGEDFPRQQMMGEEIIIPKDQKYGGKLQGGDIIPYLKFIKCDMSPFHQATLNHALENGTNAAKKYNEEDLDAAEEAIPDDMPHNILSVPSDGYAIYDVAFPNPDSDEYGLFKSSEISRKIGTSDVMWQKQHEINVKRIQNTNVITGSWLKIDNLKKHTTKYARIISDTLAGMNTTGIGSNGHKEMYYHDRVRTSGTYFIREIMENNGFIDHVSDPKEHTLCVLCKKELRYHDIPTTSAEIEETLDTANQFHNETHAFVPARFLLIHSGMDFNQIAMANSMFNSRENTYGEKLFILIGSRMIKESYDFKSITKVRMFSLPVNIPTLIQILGRSARNKSHQYLPPDKQLVQYYIYISTSATGETTPELFRYVEKMNHYLVAQIVEREIYKKSIDADIYMSNKHMGDNKLGNLSFDPVFKTENYVKSEADSQIGTYIAYKHFSEEINILTEMIKKLFIIRPVWTYDDLWAEVQHPVLQVEYNPAYFRQDNFNISLNNIVRSDRKSPIQKKSSDTQITDAFLIERMHDPMEKYIYRERKPYKVEHIGKYYILFPANNDKTDIDADTYLRSEVVKAAPRININKFVEINLREKNYNKYHDELIENLQKDTFDITDFITNHDDVFQKRFVSDVIEFFMSEESKIRHENKMRRKPTQELYAVYVKIIRMLNRFKAIISYKYIQPYNDVKKMFVDGLPDMTPNCPIGYVTEQSCKLYDIINNKWLEVDKKNLNKYVMNITQENNIMIGFLSYEQGKTLFKIRKPVSKITKTSDKRNIETGIVCATKSKTELFTILKSLGGTKQEIDKVQEYCKQIFKKLIEKEMVEIKEDSNIKYFYGWWDEPLDVQQHASSASRGR